MTRFLIFIGVLALTVLFGCSNRPSFEFIEKEGLKYKFSSFIASIEKFPYDAPPSRIEKVLKGFQKLSLKMKQEEVLSLLGEPDAEFLTYDVKKGDLFLNSSWEYVLHRHEADLANDKYDKAIYVYFDRDSHFYWGLPTNVQGLLMIGSPDQNSRPGK
ncbi:MAG: hypothetical protein ACHQYP_05295 [Nitrospiria bacterium]